VSSSWDLLDAQSGVYQAWTAVDEQGRGVAVTTPTYITDTHAAYVLSADSGSSWLCSRVISVLGSGAEGPGFKSQPRRCRITAQRRRNDFNIAGANILGE